MNLTAHYRMHQSINSRFTKISALLLFIFLSKTAAGMPAKKDKPPRWTLSEKNAATVTGRAAQSTTLLVDIHGDPTGNFDIKPYVDGVNCTWTKEFAWKALKWERRLEMACEGFRAYDLMRWGIFAEEMNAYFDVERTRRPHLANAKFTKERDEYLPIPKGQIDLSQNLYRQNYGY